MTGSPHFDLPGRTESARENPGGSIGKLRRFARQAAGKGTVQRTSGTGAEPERCELCSEPLGPNHRHLLETRECKVVCACDPCALRFTDVVDGRFKLIPRDPSELPEFQFDGALWEGFALPINLVFFYHSSPSNRTVALYPSPAGATESLLPLETWKELAQRNPELSGMEPDVEALLVDRTGKTARYFITPIDRCYALVGLLRMHWRGLSGGDRVWSEIAAFFDTLAADSRPRNRDKLRA